MWVLNFRIDFMWLTNQINNNTDHNANCVRIQFRVNSSPLKIMFWHFDRLDNKYRVYLYVNTDRIYIAAP